MLIMLEDLSKYASLIVLSCGFALILLLEVGEGSTTCSSINLNQLEAGSIIVRHMMSISVLFLSQSMYGPIKSTYTASQGGNSSMLSREFSILFQAYFVYLAGLTVFDI
jgi:hypothetical protein